MKGPLTAGGATKPSAASRNNSIDITDATTLNQLRGLDISISENDVFGPRGGGGGNTPRSSSSKVGGSIRRGSHSNRLQQNRMQEKMGQSLNFLNLDRRQTLVPMSQTTVGGASPRLRMMQLRIRRLKKTSPTERLYQSDSALFSSANAGGGRGPNGTHGPSGHQKIEDQRHDIWFKSLYPKQGALEKLDEAEAEFEESQRADDDENFGGGSDHDFDDMMNMSGTDMWLFQANQSAPGFLPGDRKAKAAAAASSSSEGDEKSYVRRP